MSLQKINPRFTVILLFIIGVAAVRIPNAMQLASWANFTPIGAMSLFSGSYFTKQWKAILFPLLTLLISDLVIQSVIFKGQYGMMYNGWYWIYAIFVLITFIGKALIKKVTVVNVLMAAVIASITHWFISDFLVWFAGGTDLRTMLPLSRNWSGLVQCYAQGFPFMKNFLMGTLIYGGIMFGAFEWMKSRYSSLRLQVI